MKPSASMIAGFLWVVEPSGIPLENHKTSEFQSVVQM